MGEKLELAVAILNGAVGDYLARTGNGLATELSWVVDGEPRALSREALLEAFPSEARSRTLLVLLPGLMCTESVWTFPDGGPGYGERLAKDFGVSVLHLRYNTGLPIPDNGESLDAFLDDLVRLYPGPVDELVLLGFSMGGLVIRAATHVAKTRGHAWLSKVSRVFYVGTPHRGSPLERVGRVVSRVLAAIPDPYTRLAAQLADLRSAGVKDLGDGDVRHEDRARRAASLSLRDPAHPVPLLSEIRHYLIAGALSEDPRLAAAFGDALVPLPSGTFATESDAPLPPSRVKVFTKMAHMTLAHDARVYETLVDFWKERS